MRTMARLSNQKRAVVRLVAVFAGLLALMAVVPASAQNPGNPTILKEIQSLREAIEGLQLCPTDVRRLFYLTPETVAADQPTTACAAGYHYASLWEIFETSNLKYNTDLGLTTADAGQGPPAVQGWIRTGSVSSANSLTAGIANCAAWTTASATSNGTIVKLPDSWQFASDRIMPWATTTAPCNFTQHVWCVQD